MNFHVVRNLLNTLNEQEFSGGVDVGIIRSTEERLNVSFPDDYVEFLSKLGAGYASSEEFIGLGGESYLKVDSIYLDLISDENQRFPKFLIPVRADGFGNYDCIDLKKSTNLKSKIVFWGHGKKSEDLVLISDGFWEWMEMEVKEVQEFDSQA